MAGSSMAFTYDETGPIKKIIADWVSDDGTGAVEGTCKKICGRLLKGVTDPSATAAPSDNYDIVITDEEGVNVLGGCDDDLQARDTANTEQVYFLLANSTPVGVGAFPVVCDKLTFSVSSAGNSKAGQIIIYWQ